jgi:hypothetical protein
LTYGVVGKCDRWRCSHSVRNRQLRLAGRLASKFEGAYNETQAKQKALAAAQNYVDRYEKRHCQVKVMPGLMKEPLPLEDIYTAVKLLDDKSVRYFAAIDDLEKAYREKGNAALALARPSGWMELRLPMKSSY